MNKSKFYLNFQEIHQVTLNVELPAVTAGISYRQGCYTILFIKLTIG